MTDVRALLAAERESRRIVHPHLTYSKAGALTCNICNLNVKSEQLWPGHQKSLNHRKNLQKMVAPPPRPTKRKIEYVDEDEDHGHDLEVDSRKKQRSFQDQPPDQQPQPAPPQDDNAQAPHLEADVPENQPAINHDAKAANPEPPSIPPPTEPASTTAPVVDEDEWAAFERDVAPLAQSGYATATIEAAPVSAAELAEQPQRSNAGRQRADEAEAEAEKEDESRRMEEEFEVMEEMEDRVKRLRARREALRTQDPPSGLQNVPASIPDNEPHPEKEHVSPQTLGDSSSDDEVDDWYS